MHYLKFSILPLRQNPGMKFNEKSVGMFGRVLMNADTVTQSRFHKNRPYITSTLISLQSVFILSPSVDRIAPFLKENQQLHDA